MLVEDRGFPYVLKHFPKRAKMSRKKGDELANLSKLLGAYHDWAHDVFPKLVFPDFIDRVRKLASNAMVRDLVSRMRYQSEHGVTREEMDLAAEPTAEEIRAAALLDGIAPDMLFGDEGGLGGWSAVPEQPAVSTAPTARPSAANPAADDDFDLAALEAMRELETQPPVTSRPAANPAADDDFDLAALEAMRELETQPSNVGAPAAEDGTPVRLPRHSRAARMMGRKKRSRSPAHTAASEAEARRTSKRSSPLPLSP